MSPNHSLGAFRQHIAPFLERMQQRNLSELSIDAYRRDLQQLCDLLAEKLNEEQELSAMHLRHVLMRLSQKGLNPRSLGRKTSVWKQYALFLRQHHGWENDLSVGLKAPKTNTHLPKAVPAEPLNQWFSHGTDKDDAMAIRDQAMFELLYGCGLRLSELRALDINDVQLEAGWVSVQGKGNKQRQVPLGLQARLAIEAYLPLRQAATDENALFTSRLGTRIGQRQIQLRLDVWA